MGRLEGKVAIVTGGGRGVGRGIALALSKEGASVVISGRTEEKLRETVRDIESFGGTALGMRSDVGVREQVDAVVEKTVETFGTVHILVNNAQTIRESIPIMETTDEDVMVNMQTGFMGTLYFMQACFPLFEKQGGGKIINVGSTAGISGQRNMAAYGASKEAIRALTRTAYKEWAKYNITAYFICPFANSPSWERMKIDRPRLYDAAVASTPLKRVGDCEKDVGRVVVFLAHSDSDYITGSTLMIDGGGSVIR